MELIAQILKYPEVSELIDELFFEHHINMDHMVSFWATGHTTVFQSDSMKLFRGMRERGIRAHSWV
jgi:hypothetical protein